MTTDTLEAPAAAPAAPTEFPSTATAHFLPLASIRPSQYNPRQRFDQAKLEDLADKIARQGVLQAIVVREVPALKPGGATYEIVAGERRWRASNLLVERGFAPPHVILAFIRDLDDFEAREVALAENSGRDDLHPLEEAQAYENLLLRAVDGGEFDPPRLKGYTVEQLADRIGHKPNFVYGRLKLLQLIPAARDAFLEDTLKLKVAEALARLPAKEQERELPALLRGWGGEPFTHKQALQHIRDHCMLKLAKAIFPIADAALLSKAGACTECPKRSSASPELFADAIGSEDLCLDGDCHQAKCKAHAARQIKHAKDAGRTVLTGAEADKLLNGRTETSDYTLRSIGHLDLDKPAEELTGSRKPLRKLLGEDFAGAKLVKAKHDDQPVTIAAQADVKAALKARGLLVPSVKSKPGEKTRAITPDDIKAKRSERIDKMLAERVHAALAKHLEGDKAEGFPGGSETWLRWLADFVHEATDADVGAIEAALTGGKVTGRLVDAVAGEKLARALIMLVIGTQIAQEFEPWNGKTRDPKPADKLASDIGFDLPALRAEIAEEVDGAIRDEIQALADVVAPAAKKATGMQKASGGKVLPKYRDAMTGETWSGRGLQPKWLKVALANGKTLADFDIANAANDEPLTPEKALAKAVAGDGAAKSVPAKPPRKTAKSVPAAAPAPAAGASRISDTAAWPFPTNQQQ